MIPGLGIIQDVEQGLPMSPATFSDPGGLGINPVDQDAPLLEKLLLMMLLQGGFDPNALAGQMPHALGSGLAGGFASHVGGISKKKSGGGGLDSPPAGP